jgi:hypothetical protein
MSDCGKVVESGAGGGKKSTDSICLDYVMKYSLAEIRSSSGDVRMNQLCSEYIQNKEAFVKYVEDKRKITGRSCGGGDGCGGNEEVANGNKN